MTKLLEKTLRDAIKEKKCIIGTRDVIKSIKNSKLVIMSQSVQKNFSDEIIQSTKKEKIPTVHFKDSSVALGRLCGLQFRVATLSLISLNNSNIQSILKESETED